MSQITLSLPEILALIGLVQCLYLAGYVALRSGHGWRVLVPVVYFLVLGGAFLSDLLSAHVIWDGDHYFYLQWALWFLGPPLSVLLVIQFADMTRLPPVRDAWVLLLLPLSMMLSHLSADSVTGCRYSAPCEMRRDLMHVTGLMAGTISLLVIFSKKDLMAKLSSRSQSGTRADQKNDKARYWLIFALIALNSLFLLITLLGVMGPVAAGDVIMLRNLIGLGFVYLVSTSLLRLYPQVPRAAVSSAESPDNGLSEEERHLARRIENLLNLEKVYQEPTYSRADLARECAVPEGVLSRIINMHFQKTFPQIMNERRIADARRLLEETEAPIQLISADVGFNSLPSFNRVFKEMVGDSPSQYRQKKRPPPKE